MRKNSISSLEIDSYSLRYSFRKEAVFLWTRHKKSHEINKNDRRGRGDKITLAEYIFQRFNVPQVQVQSIS